MISSNPGPRAIRLRGVRQNNLKNVDCDLPLGRLSVITGVSGSGKSSLAFDTLYAEGQRRYLETFSAYTRQFLERIPRPDMDEIDGIPPAVAIDPYGAIKTSRSTVGTMTGVNDYLKLLFARASTAVCPECGREVAPTGRDAVLAALADESARSFPVVVTARLSLRGFDAIEVVQRALTAQGLLRCRTESGVVRVDELSADDLSSGELDVVVDRWASARVSRARRAEAVERGLRLGGGELRVYLASGDCRAFSERLACRECEIDILPPSPALFSFNHPYGACRDCRGFGRVIELDWNRVVPDPRLSLEAGAVKPWETKRGRGAKRRALTALRALGLATDVPFSAYSAAERKLVLEGDGSFSGVRGFFRRLESKKYKMHVRVFLARFRGYEECPKCRGGRLRLGALAHRVRDRTLPEIWALPIRDLLEVFPRDWVGALARPARLIGEEIRSRLEYLDAVGLGYLSLGRQSRTLSGGEVERVNLTSALGACLVDTLFVLDEPSIGLHARDNDRLLGILRAVRDRGNTVVVVEHDPALMSAAEFLVDLGPGSGERGGEIVAAGSVEQVMATAKSLTGAYLRGEKSVAAERTPRPIGKQALRVRGAEENNLGGGARGLDIDVPLGGWTVVSGVSGSGKSTLLEKVLWRSYLHERGRGDDGPPRVRSISGFDLVDEVVLVDQSPIGKTPRGNPATYTKIFDRIRALFAASPAAKRNGFEAGHFSFNVEGGRCPECSGAGYEQVEMQFLSDVTLVCEACAGRRFRDAVLEVRVDGRNVADVLELTIAEAASVFEREPGLAESLDFLAALGLGYLRLGQPINTLSGGEAQRLKLAGRVLAARRERLLFLLDEPTTGLHLDDVRRLIAVFDELVARGHSLVVIEHHLDVIAAADHVIDLGPEGGDAGGRLVASGTPRDLAANWRETGSVTGDWLERHFGGELVAKDPPAPTARSSDLRPAIRVVGARENNLRGIDVSLPLHELVVVTGLSGSGKSSLVYDIVFAEGQRRYLDCLSPYARQFIEDLRRPDIDHLEGIPPTVAIEQRTSVGGRRSTVGTVTEIYQLLRLLYARCGVQMCPDCGDEVAPRPEADIVREVGRLARRGGRLLAPVVRGKKGFHSKLLAGARRRGILDARVDGEWLALLADREVRLERHRAHDIDLVVGSYGRDDKPLALRDEVGLGLELGGGVVRFLARDGTERVLNRHRSCPSCERDFDEPQPRSFSFHSTHGRCPECGGDGVRLAIEPERWISHWNAPPTQRGRGPFDVLLDPPFAKSTRTRVLRSLRSLEEAGRLRGGGVDRPLASWSKRALAILFDGDRSGTFAGLRAIAEVALARLEPDAADTYRRAWGGELPCEACAGGRLARDSLAVEFAGRSIGELAQATTTELRAFFAGVKLRGRDRAIAGPIVDEVRARLEFLDRVGLSYLDLNRSAATLSTGEAQRIRLAAQLGSKLRGACYILDEPTIGLHPRDNAMLLSTLRDLRDRGNSVLVIEHDEETIEAADTVVDMGPGPGRHGGEIVFQGSVEALLEDPRSATAVALRERRGVTVTPSRRDWHGEPAVVVRGAHRHNLSGIDVRFPLGAVTLVTGVSGAGKSTLVRDVLEESVRRHLRGLHSAASGCAEVAGAALVDAIREVDQLPIGRTPRSTPATYVGFWDRIRAAFAATPEARTRGYDKRRFSFNVGGGRCDACAGQGRLRVEMNFLPDVEMRCESCGGRRFNSETLEITYRGKTIADVLAMDVEAASEFFAAYPEIARSLAALADLGLGYLTLGQASTTLSGGEAQRVKLAVELAKTAGGTCLYLLDEPTTGLHLRDVEKLARVLRRLAEAGHAVVVVEHHVELIAGADWVIDLGPEGGSAGGGLVYEGAPAGLIRARGSHTGRALAGALERRR